MRRTLIAAALCLPLPAHAETISQEIARAGLAATEIRLTEAAATDADRFALGGVQFLRAIEQSYQTRWQTGLSDPTGMLPLLRLPVAANPDPAAFDPATLVTIFADASVQLGRAQATLSAIPDSAGFGVEIALSDLWFDVNLNAARDAEEGLMDIAGPALLGWQWAGRDPATPFPTIRFDGADAAWLAAYAHLLAGISDLIRAYDPTEPISRVIAARARMETLGTFDPDMIFGTQGPVDAVDIAAMLLATLNQTPDKARMASAQQHFLAMVVQNRVFWARVAMESDNDREWLPNDKQQSALGLTLPAGTGAVWQGVLADAEAILTGTRLVPYWRLNAPAGVNVARMFTDPAPIDLAGWIQGWAALPYLEQGVLVSAESWQAFESLTSGNAMLMALYLN